MAVLKSSFYLRFSSRDEGKVEFTHERQETFAESVRLASFQQSLANGDAASRKKLDAAAILKNPAARSQQFVDLLARLIFRFLHESAENSRDLAM
jgi:hypothetical protein